MPEITDMVRQQLTPDVVRQIGRQLGVDEQQARQGIDVALPLLVSALNRNASSYDGAEALSGAVMRDHDGSVLDRPDEVVRNYQSTDGSAILGHILGGQRGSVEQAASRGTGIDMGALLQILAPLVMGAIGKYMRERQLDPGGLSGELNREQQQYERSQGGLMGVITGLLDTNKDGSAFDEVAGMLGRMLQQRTGR